MGQAKHAGVGPGDLATWKVSFEAKPLLEITILLDVAIMVSVV